MLESLRMDGKRVIVTGAGRGLGRQMALHLADAGADIVCAARTRTQIAAVAEEIEAKGRRALIVPHRCQRLIASGRNGVADDR